MPHWILSLALVSLSLPAAAQVYRCTNAAGKVEFSDAPCAATSADSKVVAPKLTRDAQQLQLENEQLRRQMAEEQNRRLRAELDARNAAPAPAPAAPPPAPGRTQADLQAERTDTIECQRARRDYEVTLSSVANRGKAPAAEAAMHSACGMRTPDRTIIINRGSLPGNCVRMGNTLSCN